MKSLAFLFLLALPSAGFAAGRCVGFAESCELIPAAICYMQTGCSMNPTTHECTGFPFQCTLMSGKTSCVNQRGCQWQTTRHYSDLTESKRD